MEIFLQEHEWCNGQGREVTKIEVHAGMLVLHAGSVTLHYPYEPGKLVVEVLHTLGRVLTLHADDQLSLRIDGSLVIDSWPDGRLLVTCSRHGLFQVKAMSLTVEEADPSQAES
jgi:hypothetical protein